MRVGFVGLGSMGAPMAQRIVESGDFDSVLWARRAQPLDPFRGGPARIADSLTDLSEGLDVLCTCVFDAAGTREILFGAGGCAETLPKGAIILCHSTVSPEEVREIAAEAESRGFRLVDAPVSGGAPKALAGELVVMVGGDSATVEEARPVLASFSNQIVLLGGVGAGQHAKLINNTLLTAHIGIADDAFALGTELGLDRVALGQILTNGSGRSFGIEMYAGAQSLTPLAKSQAGPTLSKDVQLLDKVAEGHSAGQLLLTPANVVVEEFKRLAAE
jgi:3-hydroxyisobutyrate dehydrogenase